MWELISGWNENDEIVYRYSTLVASPMRLLDQQSQNYIEQYEYCKNFGVSPYPGSYIEHPALWIDAAYIIKVSDHHAMAYAEKKAMQKQQFKGHK